MTTTARRFSPFTRFVLWSFGGLLLIGMLMPVVVKATMTDEERAVAAAQEAARVAEQKRRAALSVAAYQCAEGIKRQMKNPASFEKVGHSTDGKRVYVTFRGTNSFNAVVTNELSCPLPTAG